MWMCLRAGVMNHLIVKMPDNELQLDLKMNKLLRSSPSESLRLSLVDVLPIII